MTRNQTAIDLICAIGAEVMALLLPVLAMEVAVTQYFSAARDRMRRFDVKLRKPAVRRGAA
jgi:hypothetical protein